MPTLPNLHQGLPPLHVLPIGTLDLTHPFQYGHLVRGNPRYGADNLSSLDPNILSIQEGKCSWIAHGRENAKDARFSDFVTRHSLVNDWTYGES